MSANKAFDEWKAGAVANSELALYTMDDDLRAAWLASRKAALEEAAKACHMTTGEMLLLAGEMTTGEIRTAHAIMNSRERAILALKGKV